MLNCHGGGTVGWRLGGCREEGLGYRGCAIGGWLVMEDVHLGVG